MKLSNWEEGKEKDVGDTRYWVKMWDGVRILHQG